MSAGSKATGEMERTLLVKRAVARTRASSHAVQTQTALKVTVLDPRRRLRIRNGVHSSMARKVPVMRHPVGQDLLGVPRTSRSPRSRTGEFAR